MCVWCKPREVSLFFAFFSSPPHSSAKIFAPEMSQTDRQKSARFFLSLQQLLVRGSFFEQKQHFLVWCLGRSINFFSRCRQFCSAWSFYSNMSSRRSVKVCIRTRPTHYFAQDNITIENDEKTIQLRAKSAEISAGLSDNRQSNFKFRFDHVFHNASQSNVYDLYCRDTVLGVVDGINGAIMAYGQTGSGKTFTMVRICKL
jgi:hypothetical protein